MRLAPSAFKRPARATLPRCAAACALAVLLSSCVSVYQPLVSLQRPVALRTDVANFEGQRILVRCFPGDYLNRADATRLCAKVRTVFSNQGAQVEVDVPSADGSGGEAERAAKPDLVIELRSRLVHQDNSKLLWLACWVTLTIVPAVTEYTFAQDVEIHDGRGFLLASDSYQGRFVRYFGVPLWAINAVVDWVRPPAESVSIKALQRDFSRDYFGQLSQLAFDARMRSAVLHSFQVESAKAQGN